MSLSLLTLFTPAIDLKANETPPLDDVLYSGNSSTNDFRALLAELQKSVRLQGNRGGVDYIFRDRVKSSIVISEFLIEDKGAQVRASVDSSSSGVKGEPGADFWMERFRPLFTRSTQRSNGQGDRQFISFRNGGLVYTDDGVKFKRVTALPRRFVPEDYSGPVLYRDIEDLWQNPQNPQQLLALNKRDILLSEDGGESFKNLGNGGVHTDFSSIAGQTDSKGRLTTVWLGTAVNGIYRLKFRAGKLVRGSAQKENRGLSYERHDESLNFYETVIGIAVDKKRKLIITATNFDQQLYVAALPDTSTQPVYFKAIPLKRDRFELIQSLYYDEKRGQAVVSGESGINLLDLNSYTPGAQLDRTRQRRIRPEEIFANLSDNINFAGLFLSKGQGRISLRLPETKRFSGVKRNTRAFYISPTSARKRHDTISDLLKNYGFNAVVIDIKDDYGRLVYGSRLPMAKAMNNHRERAPIRSLVKKLKEQNIYLIARMVVFKDTQLYNYQKNRYAIRDSKTGGPWEGNSPERWVDSYSTEVQNYNISVAREALELGFDEIQFDYIRFPSDGPVSRCRYSYATPGAYKSEALEAFLRKARATISAPLSIDIYGYNGFYRVAGGIGQDIVDLGDYVDVVSPMHYSSHFGPLFLEGVEKSRRTYELINMGVARPNQLSGGRFLIRPWLQSFKMSTERWGWGEEYMTAQIKGVMAGGSNGFLWWGPIQEFYLPGRAQKQLFSATLNRD